MSIGTFCSDWVEKSPLECELLATIQRKGTDLALSRAVGEFALYDCETGRSKTLATPAYRLESPNHRGQFDFLFTEQRLGYDVQSVMLEIEPPLRGNFFNLRSFLLDEVASTLFGLERFIVYRILGHALSGEVPSQKLVKLYQRLGAVRMPHVPANVMVLLNPRTEELLERINPIEATYLREAKIFERHKVSQVKSQ